MDLTLEQILDVQLVCDFAGCINTLVEKSASAAKNLRQAVSSIYTESDIGVYWNPAYEKAAIYVRPELNQQEADWCLDAMTAKVGSDHVRREPLEQKELGDWWVKVAYSPTLRTILNALQFLPSSADDEIGGRPIASTIASGLLGAGLGYGSGWLYEKMTPEWLREDKKPRKNFALIGSLLGAGAGAVPGLINWHEGRSFNDPTLWTGQPYDGLEKGSEELCLPLREKQAVESLLEKNSSTMGGPSFQEMPLIKTDKLGRVIYDTGLGPQTAAQVMGVVHGANQFPDPRSRPGVVTPHQTGLLGLAMGAAGGGLQGYATGQLVGQGLGLLTGMPAGTQKMLSQGGAAAGILSSLAPMLFK